MPEPLFEKIALVGIGLIGSSLARVIRREHLARHIAIATRSPSTLKRAEELDLGDSYSTDLREAVREADLVVFMDHGRIAEMGTFNDLSQSNGRFAALLRASGILTDEDVRRSHTAA